MLTFSYITKELETLALPDISLPPELTAWLVRNADLHPQHEPRHKAHIKCVGCFAESRGTECIWSLGLSSRHQEESIAARPEAGAAVCTLSHSLPSLLLLPVLSRMIWHHISGLEILPDILHCPSCTAFSSHARFYVQSQIQFTLNFFFPCPLFTSLLPYPFHPSACFPSSSSTTATCNRYCEKSLVWPALGWSMLNAEYSPHLAANI